MTEEDTFNRLMRISIDEMFWKLNNFHRTREYLDSSDPEEASKNFLKEHDWEFHEYLLKSTVCL